MKIPFISIAKLNVSAKKLSPFYRNTNDLTSGASSIPNLPVTSSHIYKPLKHCSELCEAVTPLL